MKSDSECMLQALVTVLDEMCLTLSRAIVSPQNLTEDPGSWRTGTIDLICRRLPGKPQVCSTFTWAMGLDLSRHLVSRFLGLNPRHIDDAFAWDAIREVQNVAVGRYLDVSGKSSTIDLGIPGPMTHLNVPRDLLASGAWRWLELEDKGNLIWRLDPQKAG